MAKTLFILILALAPLWGEDFIFWAKLTSKNQLIKSQNIAISRAMRPHSRVGIQLCEIQSPLNKNESSLNYLKRHTDRLFECFGAQPILLKNSDLLHSTPTTNRALTRTDLTLAPVYFSVDFTPHGAKILLLKAKK